jgi:hypothetical protein
VSTEVNWQAIGTVLSVVIGWAVGVVTPPISEWFKERRRRAPVAAALVLQVMHLRELAIGAALSLRRGSGEIDRESLRRLLQELNAAPQNILSTDRLNEMWSLLSTSHNAFEAWRDVQVASTAGFSPYQLQAPLLKRFEDLSLFEPSVQFRVLELLTSIDLSNSVSQHYAVIQGADVKRVDSSFVSQQDVKAMIFHYETIIQSVNALQPMLLKAAGNRAKMISPINPRQRRA